ncbi:MAG: hypothetical protein CW336_04040 [Bacteroidetes bacterium]|nr:hypothetical protein [Bacteroidota bacterium]
MDKMELLHKLSPAKIISDVKWKFKYLSFKPFDTSTEEGRGLERNRRIALTAFTALLAQGIALITPLVTVRLTLGYLGTEIYGLWLAISSFFAFMTHADLGLGSGLQTELSHVSVYDDKSSARKMVSSAYVLLTGVALILLLVLLISYPFVNWASVVNAQSDESIYLAGYVVLVIVIPQIVRIPISLIQRTQNAMQEAYKSNLWNIVGNLLNLLAIVVLVFFNAGKIAVITASSIMIVLVAFLNNFYYFKHDKPELTPSYSLYDRSFSRKLLKTGIAFFILSIFTTLSLSIDNWIVARIGTLEDVTPFSLMLRISAIINVVSLMFSAPLWSANGEALERGEFDWVEKQTTKIARLSALLAAGISFLIVILSNPFLHLLTAGVVDSDYILLIGMCLVNIVVSFTNPFFMVLNGARVIKFQIYNYMVYAAISLPIKFYLGVRYGYSVIPWISLLTYIFLLTIPTYIVSKRTLLKQKIEYDIKRKSC